ncbi:MAG: hypothetical protein JO345_34125 [Streptosporangiaceae bacterium]|nr:hypothetical protein [Streptosporangiaceae bacterium]
MEDKSPAEGRAPESGAIPSRRLLSSTLSSASDIHKTGHTMTKPAVLGTTPAPQIEVVPRADASDADATGGFISAAARVGGQVLVMLM